MDTLTGNTWGTLTDCVLCMKSGEDGQTNFMNPPTCDEMVQMRTHSKCSSTCPSVIHDDAEAKCNTASPESTCKAEGPTTTPTVNESLTSKASLGSGTMCTASVVAMTGLMMARRA